MMASQPITALFQDFGKNIGIEGLALDDHGYCCLFFDELGVNLEVDEASNQLFLYANIGDLPPRGERLALYELLLDGNSFFQGTDGGTLGVDTETGLAALVTTLPVAGLDVNGLEGALQRFVELVRDWQERCRKVMEAPHVREEPLGASEGIRV